MVKNGFSKFEGNNWVKIAIACGIERLSGGKPI
jgi:hypothetical protein